jgi:SAM-dependent methyltransferase
VAASAKGDRGSGDRSFEKRYFTEESTYRRFRDSDAAGALRYWYVGFFRLAEQLVPGLFARRSVLEIGCGYGPMLRLLESGGGFVVGLDLSAHALGVIRAARPMAPLIRASADRIPVRADSQDVVVGLELMEHLREPERLIMEVHDCLVPGGQFVATSPNPYSDFLPGYSAWADRTHVSVYPAWRWAELLSAAGFLNVRTWSIWTIPYLWRLSPRLSRTVVLPGIGPTTMIVADKPVAPQSSLPQVGDIESAPPQ